MPLDRAQYATDAGRRHFADQLTSIRYCVQETCSARHALNTRTHTTALVPSAHTDACACQDFDVLYAYLTSANYDFSCAKTTARTLLPLSHPLTHSPPPHAPGRRRPLEEPAPEAQHPHRDEPRDHAASGCGSNPAPIARTHATTRSRNSLSPTDTVLRKRSNWASTFAPAH